MHFSTLDEWLTWISNVHTTGIELGLDRVKVVAERLDILKPICPVIIVGGTNGKGSTVAGLEAIYLAAGYHVGAFTSPVLLTHNEQVRIDRGLASDSEFCAAFAKVESARGNISLTSFEFHTLAALLIFKTYMLDVLILEVGLGGRLDAVNIMDADVAIVTSIDIDHVNWLGSTREDIAFEKAGIFRAEKPAVCGDSHPPISLINYAATIGAPLFCQGREFNYQENNDSWSWSFLKTSYHSLPQTSLALQNMSTVLMAITLMQDKLPVARDAIIEGLANIKLRARIEVINEPVMKIFDVAHNPAAVAMLEQHLKKIPCHGKTHAVFSMLADKDILESIKKICDTIDNWYVAALPVNRGATAETLMNAFHKAEIQNVTFFSSIEEAYNNAKLKAQLGDRIVVFGSFHTVAEVLFIK